MLIWIFMDCPRMNFYLRRVMLKWPCAHREDECRAWKYDVFLNLDMVYG